MRKANENEKNVKEGKIFLDILTKYDKLRVKLSYLRIIHQKKYAMLATIVLAIIVIALVLREVFDAKKKKREKIEAELKSRIMPSGLILPKDPEEMLVYKKADLIKWDKEDIKFLI